MTVPPVLGSIGGSGRTGQHNSLARDQNSVVVHLQRPCELLPSPGPTTTRTICVLALSRLVRNIQSSFRVLAKNGGTALGLNLLRPTSRPGIARLPPINHLGASQQPHSRTQHTRRWGGGGGRRGSAPSSALCLAMARHRSGVCRRNRTIGCAIYSSSSNSVSRIPGRGAARCPGRLTRSEPVSALPPPSRVGRQRGATWWSFSIGPPPNRACGLSSHAALQ
jgi:hypothetical protein